MNYFKLYTVFLLSLLVFSACEKEMGPTIPNNAVAPVLINTLDGNTYVLLDDEKKNDFVKLTWEAADFKLAVSPEYKLEVADAGTEFKSPITIATTFGLEKSYTVKSFNQVLLDGGYQPETTYNLELRVVSGDYLVSNVVSFTVTTFLNKEPDVWSIIGSSVRGWDLANDVPMVYDEDSETYKLTLTLKAGEYKFRAALKAENPWLFNLGLVGDKRSIQEETGIALVKDGANIMTLGGDYSIVLDVKNATCAITLKSEVVPVEYPAALYMTGASLNAVGDGGWSWDTNVATLNPVHSNPHLFWAIVYLDPTVADAGFKLSPEKSWDLAFGVSGEATDGVFAKGDANIQAPAAGYYNVVVDLENEKVEVLPPAVYILGNAIGDWNVPNEANKFAIDNTAKVLSITKTFEAGNLRMQVSSSLLLGAWWTSEFNVFDGNIVFRGTGDDQAEVLLEAGDHTITLDFMNGTGTIE